MKILSFIFFLVTLSSCALFQKDQLSIEEATSRKNPIFVEQNEIGFSNFPLSEKGQEQLSVFLAKVELDFISDQYGINGDKRLTKDICDALFRKKNMENNKIKGSICEWNLTEDKSYFDFDPIIFSLSELDNKYLLLFIDEAGLGAPQLFTYLFDLSDQSVVSFEQSPLGEGTVYYKEKFLYFVNVAGYLEKTINIETLR